MRVRVHCACICVCVCLLPVWFGPMSICDSTQLVLCGKCMGRGNVCWPTTFFSLLLCPTQRLSAVQSLWLCTSSLKVRSVCSCRAKMWMQACVHTCVHEKIRCVSACLSPACQLCTCCLCSGKQPQLSGLATIECKRFMIRQTQLMCIFSQWPKTSLHQSTKMV